MATSLKVLDMITESAALRQRLAANTRLFRERMTAISFSILPGEHPIVPIMIGDATLAGRMAERLLEKGVYAIGFSYPVVPQGKARVRVQVSAAHTREEPTMQPYGGGYQPQDPYPQPGRGADHP